MNNNLKENAEKFIRDNYPFLLFFVLMFAMHLVMGFNGDDLKYVKVLSNQNLFDFLYQRYYYWSSSWLLKASWLFLFAKT